MTDDIKVGDRPLVPVTVIEISREREYHGASAYIQFSDGTHTWCDLKVLSTCQRLPPEIGVGDEVRHKKWEAHCKNSFVRAIVDGWAWVAEDIDDDGLAYPLSDLTLVKKAEKD